MLILILSYILIAFGGVIALASMILRIGTLMGDCPITAARAKTASLTIATGFAAIGAGGVILIGAAIPVLQQEPAAALMIALGFAALSLGLGFTHAVATLRAVTLPPEPVKMQTEVAPA
ncbi:hypothetical protein [Ascidiaceihabitans sp.]|uniref:hypothetical protein n=1 Tax=Ascidiaceihabitans sp. TaxID=1872644 RepID=UPI003297B9E6